MKVYVVEVWTNYEGGGTDYVSSTIELARERAKFIMDQTRERWDKYRAESDPDETGYIANYGIFKPACTAPDFEEWTDGTDYVSIRGFEVR